MNDETKPPVEQTTELRRTGLGGSDMAAILGLDPYRSPLHVFLEKTGRVAPANLDAVDIVWFGKEAEDLVAKFYTRRTGHEVARVPGTMRIDGHPHIMAHPDRYLVKLPRGLEIKTTDWRLHERWGDEGSDEIPEYYLPQVHCYMLVAGWEAMEVACLMGRDLLLYRVERSERWDRLIIETADEFWKQHVMLDRMPSLDYNALTLDALKRAYPKPLAGSIMDGTPLLHLLQTKDEVLAKIKMFETTKDGIDAMLLEHVGTREWAILPDGKSLRRIHVAAAQIPAHTRPAYSYFRSVRTPKQIAALLPVTITGERVIGTTTGDDDDDE